MKSREELYNFCGVCGGLAFITPTSEIIHEELDDTIENHPRCCDCPSEDDY